MNDKEIIFELQSNASEKHKANVIRMGIPEEFTIGVSTATIRKLAKKVKKSNELAWKLWETKYHEAKLLAVLLFDISKISSEDIEYLMSNVISWDLCDHMCKNLIIKTDYCDKFITRWVKSFEIYKKRAAFTLIATSAMHVRNLTDDIIDDYLCLISEYSQVEHEHVRKAVVWALREVGKRDFSCNEKALLVAYKLKKSKNKEQVWIAKNAIKVIGNVVKVDERSRLLSVNTKKKKQGKDV
ncbi:DNA alkylation repair protein [Tetragenococcus solitarius]|uniref:DNA alkylation repair protein n=1 Tax=Tetragenococcus solitarius TaxID=71453 RepID=A0ABN3YEX2_9ENTE|nr:DNA alkylation repair protein [Tetragenococcus solitarius]